MTAEVHGEVDQEDGVLVIRRIHVTYTLKAAREHEEAIRRAHQAHPPKCPVYKSLCGCIDITTELDLVGS